MVQTLSRLMERRGLSGPRDPAVLEEARKRAAGILMVERFFREARGREDERTLVREAFSTSDFPLAFNWFTDLRMLTSYQSVPPAWQRFLARSVVPDFRPAARDRLQGLNAPMPIVPEGTDYVTDQVLGPGDRNQDLVIAKTGRTFDITFEAQVNDVLRQLTGIPGRLAEAARRTEMLTAATAYVANSSIYGTHAVGSTNFVNKGTGVLTVANLKTAITFMRTLKDDNGNPIYTGDTKLRLVVPGELEITADQILGAQNFVFDADVVNDGTHTRQITGNTISPMVERVTDYYITTVDGTHGATSWYLFADPDQFPAGEVAFLAGHETPELWQKQPNAIRITDTGVTGGLANPLDGQFENDAIKYKVRHAGATNLHE